MTPSGHKAFLVSNVKDVELLLMHNKTYAAEYVHPHLKPGSNERDDDSLARTTNQANMFNLGLPTTSPRGSGSTSSRGRSN